MTPVVRRLAGPSLMAAIMLALLIGLGVWQLHRLVWKRAILSAIDHAERAPAVPLPDFPGRFQKVRVTGRLRPDLRILYGAYVRDTPAGPVLGGDLIQPLFRASGPPVLIDRGWVRDTPGLVVPTPAADVSLEGYVRPPEYPGRFSAKDDPKTHRFYVLDPRAMGAALGLPQVAPFTVILLGVQSAHGEPIPATEMPRPPNDHLQYAVTWFGLALVLVAVFGSWARGIVRNKT